LNRAVLKTNIVHRLSTLKMIQNKSMQYDTKGVAAVLGLIGGMYKYIFIDYSVIGKFLEAGITAFFCGLAGVAGKYAFEKIIAKIFKKKTIDNP
jgi:hypothetical protein